MPRRTRLCLYTLFALISLLATVAYTQTLGEVLGATNLTWSTGGAGWGVTTNEGIISAGSGPCLDDDSATIETTVIGSGWLYFNWMVSSEADFDGLSFSVNDTPLTRITGFASWEWQEFYLPGPTNRLRWVYKKDSSLAAGDDRAWLRAVSFYGDDVGVTLDQLENRNVYVGQNVKISVSAIGVEADNYQWFFNSNVLVDATNSTLWLRNIQSSNAGNYRVVVSNSSGVLTNLVSQIAVFSNIDSTVTYRYPGFRRAAVAGIAVSGNNVFLGQDGVSAYDVANPAAPIFLSQSSSAGYVSGIHLFGTNVFLTGEAGGRIYNVSDPMAINESSHITSGSPGGATVVGNLLYMVGFRGMSIFDVSNPGTPVPLGSYVESTLTFYEDVQVIGSYAYVAAGDQGLVILDISNPQAITRVSGSGNGRATKVRVIGGRAYVGDAQLGLQVLDVTQPTHVVYLGAYDPPGDTYDLLVEGTFAYIVSDSAVHVLDIADPSHITLRGSISTSTGASSLCKVGSTMYVGETLGFEIFNLTSATNAVKIGGRVDLCGEALHILPTTNRLYLSDGNGGFSIFDATTPAAPTLLQQYSRSSGGGPFYVTDIGICQTNSIIAGGALLIMGDFPPGTNAQLKAALAFNSAINRMQVISNLAYIAEGQNLRIIDVSVQTKFFTVSLYATSGAALDVKVVGNRAYLANGSAGFQILDVSNPTNVVRLGGYDTPGYCRSVEVIGNLAYVADDDSLEIFDVSKPEAVVLKGSRFCYAATSVHVANDLAFVCVDDLYDGQSLAIFDVRDPANPFKVSTCLSDAGFSDVQFVNGTIYVAEQTLGLGVLSLTQTPPQVSLPPISRSTAVGGRITLQGSGTGTGPLNFQWRHNGTAIAGATESQFTIPHAGFSDAGAYDFILSNVKGAVVSSSATVSVTNSALPAPDYGTAVDASHLVWQSGDDIPWQITSIVMHTGGQAAVSGEIADDESSYLETSVTGPGVISFWWKVSSEANYDYLRFAIDGFVQQKISGEVDWQNRNYVIAAGSHVLRWSYAKDSSYSAGLDRGWLDQVSFASNGPPVVVTPPVNVVTTFGASAMFTVKAVGDGLAYQWFLGANPIDGATNPIYFISNVQPAQVGDYRVVVSNLLGSVNTSSASLRITSSAIPKLSAMQISNGNFSADIGPLPATATLIIESSTNLLDWSGMQTNVVSGTNLAISVPTAGDAGKFFRVRVR